MAEARQIPGPVDVEHLRLVRANVDQLLRRAADEFINPAGGLILDVAPQDHAGIAPLITGDAVVRTLDISPDSGATYIADLCDMAGVVADRTFDFIVCTEVLEHTLRPFDAVDEMRRVLKPGGVLFLTVPFNFRIHGPLPDCWRFTEHGLRQLLRDFSIVSLEGLETPNRPLMPVCYAAVARKGG